MKIVKKYKNFKLELQIDDNFEKGLILFVGKSGCGKTTALRILNSKNFLKNRKKVCMKAFTNFNNNFFVKDLLSFAKHKNYIEDYYKRLNIKELLDIPFNKLSKGEQRRLYFYIIISTPSDIYFFDEPFSFIDENYKQVVKEIIEEISYNNLVFVSTHHDEFECNKTTYHLENGKLIKKEIINNINKKDVALNKKIEFDNKNHILLKHNSITYSFLAVFTLVFCFISLLFSGFESVNQTRTSIDTLGIFNAKTEISLEPTKINIDKEHLYETYDLIAKNENAIVEEFYRFPDVFLFEVGNKYYVLDQLYSQNIDVAEGKMYSSSSNPYLITYFANLYPNYSDSQIKETILNHNYKTEPILVKVGCQVFDVFFDEEIKIEGVVSNTKTFFCSNISFTDFYTNINPKIRIIDETQEYQRNDSVIIVKRGLKIQDGSNIGLELSVKYPDYVFNYDNEYICATKDKNISIQQYEEYLSSNQNIFAYAFDRYDLSNYFCIKDLDFLIQNNFNYIGNLNIDDSNIIVAKNRAIKLFNDESLETLIGKKTNINGHEFTISAILTDVVDDAIYFNHDNYYNYISPIYSYIVTVIGNDYTKMDEILVDMNQNDLGFEAKLTFGFEDEYIKHHASLIAGKENMEKMFIVFVIISVIIISLLITCSAILVKRSYNLYTTLDLLYINANKFKVINVFVGLILSIATIFIFATPLKLLLDYTIFNDVLTNLHFFDVDLSINYNWAFILLSLVLIIIGEFFNGEKIQSWFKKLFKKV